MVKMIWIEDVTNVVKSSSISSMLFFTSHILGIRLFFMLIIVPTTNI